MPTHMLHMPHMLLLLLMLPLLMPTTHMDITTLVDMQDTHTATHMLPQSSPVAPVVEAAPVAEVHAAPIVEAAPVVAAPAPVVAAPLVKTVTKPVTYTHIGAHPVNPTTV